MLLLTTLAHSAAEYQCRLFLVAQTGRVAGRAGAALAGMTERPLDIAGSAVIAGYTDVEADRILDAAVSAGAHYLLLGIPDRDAARFRARVRERDLPLSAVAVSCGLADLAA